MNDPGARHPGDHVPLDQRYTGADPIEWCGAAVYPMYTEALPAGTTAVRLRAVSVMPPADVSGLGLGLTVQDGHVTLNGKSLAGVDIWSDALAEGVDISVTADAPDALFTLTPVWVAGSGTQQSWTGNYGIVVDLLPEGASTLWCSTGPGTPDFNELVVELSTVPGVDSGNAADSMPSALETMPLSIRPPAVMPPRAPSAAPLESRASAEPPPNPPTSVATSSNPPASTGMPSFPGAPSATPPSSPTPTGQRLAPPDPIATPTDPPAADAVTSASPVQAVASFGPPAPVIAPAEPESPPITAPPAQRAPQAASTGQGIGRALYDLGTAMNERGEHDSARALLTQAAEAGHSAAAYELGVLLLRAGDREGAERWWKAAAHDDPRAAASLTELPQLR